MGRVTIRHVAQRTGVSTATVSLALKQDPRVAVKTRRRVAKAASRLGYVPSNLGRALQARKSRLIAYMLSDITTSFRSELLQAVGQACTAAGYGLLTAVTDGKPETEARQMNLFEEKCVDGILVTNATSSTQKLLKAYAERGGKVVFCSALSSIPGIPFVVIDNEAGGRMAAAHLMDLGHRRLAYCFTGSSREPRYRGAVMECASRKIGAPVLCPDETALRQLLSGPTPPTALVCYSDMHAIHAKHAIEDCGLNLPRDVSLVGFDDLWMTSLKEFSLTTIAQPRKEMGKIATEMLLKSISGKRVKKRILKPKLVIRASTRKGT